MKRNYFPELINFIKFLILLTLILLQILAVFLIVFYLDTVPSYFYWIIELVGVLMALKILSSTKKYIYKLSWITFLLTLPLTAIVFYIIFGDIRFLKGYKRKENKLNQEFDFFNKQNEELLNDVMDQDIKEEVSSLYELGNYPIYSQADPKYYELGELWFEDIIDNLQKAEKFILIEFYIVARGDLYDKIKDILIQKQKEGVEIYLIYDKLGSVGRFTNKMEKELKDVGIKVVPFNANIVDFFKFINYRTHRKIVIIDGKYAYTGGNNVADEYVNLIARFGHWKDTGIRISGESTKTFIKLFFKQYMMITDEKIKIDKYLECASNPLNDKAEANLEEGEPTIVMPFADGPIIPEDIGAHNYMRIISSAKKYIYITTPYFIVDEEMLATLKLSAKSGVDVRIMIPGIPDKKMIYLVTKSHFTELVRAGVKVYTYTPGFIHAKSIVCDDKVSTVGSINFDFRSLLWNYECAVYVHGKEFASKVRADFEDSLTKSELINDKYLRENGFIRGYVYGFLRILGPLL